jgi:hypothetical protein
MKGVPWDTAWGLSHGTVGQADTGRSQLSHLSHLSQVSQLPISGLPPGSSHGPRAVHISPVRRYPGY